MQTKHYFQAVSELLEIVMDQFAVGGDRAVDWLAIEQALAELPKHLIPKLVEKFGFEVFEGVERHEDRDGHCWTCGNGVFSLHRDDREIVDGLRSEDHAYDAAYDHLCDGEDNLEILQSIADMNRVTQYMEKFDRLVAGLGGDK